MDKEQILAMPAGRELDALVAEKVMGECRHDFRVVGPNVWNHQCQKCAVVDSNFSQSTLYIAGTDKEYSTDISAAWEVMEELNKRYDDVAVYSTNGGWGCNIAEFLPPNDEFEYDANVTKTPEAICKAALLAVMEL